MPLASEVNLAVKCAVAILVAALFQFLLLRFRLTFRCA